VPALDLKQSVVLERFEFSVAITDLSLAHGWIHQILESLTSPVFNEFVIWVLGEWYPTTTIDGDDWKAVDASLVSLAERNPGLRLVLTGNGDSSPIPSYLPLATSGGLIRTGSTHGENRFKKFGMP